MARRNKVIDTAAYSTKYTKLDGTEKRGMFAINANSFPNGENLISLESMKPYMNSRNFSEREIFLSTPNFYISTERLNGMAERGIKTLFNLMDLGIYEVEYKLTTMSIKNSDFRQNVEIEVDYKIISAKKYGEEDNKEDTKTAN